MSGYDLPAGFAKNYEIIKQNYYQRINDLNERMKLARKDKVWGNLSEIRNEKVFYKLFGEKIIKEADESIKRLKCPEFKDALKRVTGEKVLKDKLNKADEEMFISVLKVYANALNDSVRLTNEELMKVYGNGLFMDFKHIKELADSSLSSKLTQTLIAQIEYRECVDKADYLFTVSYKKFRNDGFLEADDINKHSYTVRDEGIPENYTVDDKCFDFDFSDLENYAQEIINNYSYMYVKAPSMDFSLPFLVPDEDGGSKISALLDYDNVISINDLSDTKMMSEILHIDEPSTLLEASYETAISEPAYDSNKLNPDEKYIDIHRVLSVDLDSFFKDGYKGLNDAFEKKDKGIPFIKAKTTKAVKQSFDRAN